MKVQKISNNHNYQNVLKNNIPAICGYKNPFISDTFQKEPSFGGYYNIDFKNAGNMTNCAEYFYDDTDEHIRSSVCNMYVSLWGIRSKKKSEEAYSTFIPHVREVRERVKKLNNELVPLGIIITSGVCDLVEQKKELNNSFIMPLEMEKKGTKADIPNGILIHGNSNKNIDELTNWLMGHCGIYKKEVDYDAAKPAESISVIINTAQEAEKLHEITGTRTLLTVNHLDELLTDDTTLESRSLIGRFKGFIESASDKYHTTILMKTKKSLDDFDEASIGDQRFNIKVKLNERSATPQEKKRYEEVKAELKRLSDKAKNKDSLYHGDSEHYHTGSGWID